MSTEEEELSEEELDEREDQQDHQEHDDHEEQEELEKPEENSGHTQQRAGLSMNKTTRLPNKRKRKF